MAISARLRDRNRPVLRNLNQWVRHHNGYTSTPSEQALEGNPRVAYFWRR